MIRLFQELARLDQELRALELPWALVGGLAVSMRGEARTTRDIDIALVTRDDREAETIIRRLQERGYRLESLREQKETGRLAMSRLLVPGGEKEGLLVDLFFAFSGIERKVVAAATPLELEPGLQIPVATLADLLVLKTLANRGRDRDDFAVLLRYATPADIEEARRSLERLPGEGVGRPGDPLETFEELLSRGPDGDSNA